MKKILMVTGTRPNIVKIAPLYHRWKTVFKNQFAVKLIHSGQHYDYEMYGSFLSDFDLPKPDYNLETKSKYILQQIANTLYLLEKILLSENFDAVLVVGDVNSTLAATICAVKLNIPVIHLEAGVRSGDQTMTEEQNRRVVDALSSLHLAPTQQARNNLFKESISPDSIKMVGNILAETLVNFKIEDVRESYCILTLHRPFNVDQPSQLQSILKSIADQIDGDILFPAHPRTQKNLDKSKLPDNLKIMPPLPYPEFISKLSSCKAVITDSGGIQTEATILNTPCLTIRPNTEWSETITYGTNVLVQDLSLLRKHLGSALDKSTKSEVPEFWDHQVSLRCWKAIEKFFSTSR
jgi:UDP-N-acetylglucosamine 2-epimerase (non-hydrolysing)